MPVMDGFTATRAHPRARSAPSGRGKRLPIIALTANVMSEDRENCIAAGMDAHLGKPIEPAQLIDCLEPLLETRRSRAPEVDVAHCASSRAAMRNSNANWWRPSSRSGDQCLAEILAALKRQRSTTPSASAPMRSRARAPTSMPRDLAAAASSLESAARANLAGEIDGLVQELTVEAAGGQRRITRSRLTSLDEAAQPFAMSARGTAISWPLVRSRPACLLRYRHSSAVRISVSTLRARSGPLRPGGGHAEARRHAGFARARGEGRGGDRGADLFGHGHGAFVRGLRQHDQKLLAAIARNPIAVAADQFLRARRELLQHFVARGMAALYR